MVAMRSRGAPTGDPLGRRFLGRPDGTFGPRSLAFSPAVTLGAQLAVGRLDGDPIPDALVRDSRCCDTATHVYFGQPPGP
jgi:hypothetical protein